MTHNLIHTLLKLDAVILIKRDFLHSSEEDPAKRLYWDGGPKKIELFMAHHLKECENNPICNSLHLLTVKFEDELNLGEGESSKSPTRSPLRKKSKKNMFVEPKGIINID